MRLLFVGTGGGSWQMRGLQVAGALGARATTRPTAQDWAWADLIVLVKHAVDAYGALAQATQKPMVWDVLDYWQQPADNGVPVHVMAAQVLAMKRRLGCHAVIGATRQMADMIGGVYIPHHCRIGLAPTPPRARVETVGYDGRAKYLGSWRPVLEQACAHLGVRFVLNPPDLSTCDVLVAMRGEQWDGPLCRQWKSGVKVGNAISAGRPILTQPSAAQEEMHPSGLVVSHPREVTGALALVVQPDHQQLAYAHGLLRARSYTVDAIAEQYRALFHAVARRAAA